MGSAIFVLVAVIVEAILYSMNSDPISPLQKVINAVLTIALFYAVIYVPKYLHLTIETEKRFNWNLRIRWILISVLLICAPFAINGRAGYLFFLEGWLLLLGT